MASPINGTGLGCAGVLAVIVALLGYHIYDGHQRVIGLDELVAKCSASATAERMSPSLKAAFVGDDPSAPLGKAVSGFLATRQTHHTLPFSPYEPGAFKAPLAIVDLDAHAIDETQGRMPESVRAPDVRAARTLVFVRCFKGDKVGEYGWLQGAYKRTCGVIGFDMKTPGGPTMLAATSVDKDPPTSISTAEIWYAFHDVVPSRPVGAMASYVKGELAIAQP